MLIEIAEVQVRDGIQIVGFRCDGGIVSGPWIGEHPRIGDEKVVEFDTDDELAIGTNASRVDAVEPSVRSVGTGTEITAQLEAKFVEEGLVSLAFWDGRLVVEADGVALSAWRVGGWYRVLVSSLEIYDTNV